MPLEIAVAGAIAGSIILFPQKTIVQWVARARISAVYKVGIERAPIGISVIDQGFALIGRPGGNIVIHKKGEGKVGSDDCKTFRLRAVALAKEQGMVGWAITSIDQSQDLMSCIS